MKYFKLALGILSLLISGLGYGQSNKDSLTINPDTQSHSKDSLTVSYHPIHSDSIPDGYYCLIISSTSRKTKMDLYINDSAHALIDFRNYSKTPLSIYSIATKHHAWYNAYILIERDSGITCSEYLPLKVYKHVFWGLKKKRIQVFAPNNFESKYCVLREVNKKGDVLIGTWMDFIISRRL